jgi:hypothetical protein
MGSHLPIADPRLGSDAFALAFVLWLSAVIYTTRTTASGNSKNGS